MLTWLLREIDTNAPAYAAKLRAFDDFALANRLWPLGTDRRLGLLGEADH